MRAAVLITTILFSFHLSAQDLTGIWRGSFVAADRLQSLASPSDRYKLEVQIDQHDKAFNSVTYSYKTTLFYGKATATGTVNPKTGKVWLEELKIVELKMQFGSACVMTYKLQYSKNDNEEFLEGTWTGYGEKDSSFCGKGTVLLHKVPTSDFYKEPFLSKKDNERKTPAETGTGTDTATKSGSNSKTITKKPAGKIPAPGTAKNKPAVKTPGPGLTKNNPATPATKPPATKAPVTSNSKNPPVTNNVTPPAVAKSAPNKTLAPPVKKEVTPKPNNIAKAPQASIKSPESKILQTEPKLVDPDTLRKAVPQITKKTAPVIVPRVLATRENEVVKTITINTTDISINIYDNGTIDNDTVSVYLDKKLVISKQKLTTAPINVKFTMSEDNDVHELVMVAENEGDIPPNTSLMVVKAGDKEFEVRITSTEQKNAVVIFKYEKPK